MQPLQPSGAAAGASLGSYFIDITAEQFCGLCLLSGLKAVYVMYMQQPKLRRLQWLTAVFV